MNNQYFPPILCYKQCWHLFALWQNHSFMLTSSTLEPTLWCCNIQSPKTRHRSVLPGLSFSTRDHHASTMKYFSNCFLFSITHPFFLLLVQFELLSLDYRCPHRPLICQACLPLSILHPAACWENAFKSPNWTCQAPTACGTQIPHKNPPN